MLQRCSIIVGSHVISRSLNPGSSLDGESFSAPRSTHASNTGNLAQMLGPRRERTFRNSIPKSPGRLVLFSEPCWVDCCALTARLLPLTRAQEHRERGQSLGFDRASMTGNE